MSFSESYYVIQELSNKLEESLNLQEQINILRDNESKLIIASQTEPLNQPIGGLWFFLNEYDKTISYKIKREDGYSDSFSFNIDSGDIKFGDTSLTEILNNAGNIVYTCSSESNKANKRIVCDNFNPENGSKILVAFDNDNNQPVVSLSIYDNEEKLIASGTCYKDLNNELEGKKLVKNTVFQFLYQDGKFICLGGGSSSIASETLPGGVISGGDITINQETGQVTVNNSKKATLDQEGNTITPNNHASSETIYGVGDDILFGHTKIAGVDFEGDPTGVSSSIIEVKENRTRIENMEKELPTKKEENWLINGDLSYNEAGFLYGWDTTVDSDFLVENNLFSLKNGSIYQKIDLSLVKDNSAFEVKILIDNYVKEESSETPPKISLYSCSQDNSETLIKELEITETGEKNVSFNKSEIGEKIKIAIETSEKITIKNIKLFLKTNGTISPLSKYLEENFDSFKGKNNNLLVNGNFGLTEKGTYQTKNGYLYKDGWIFRQHLGDGSFEGFIFKEDKDGVFFNIRNGEIIYIQQFVHNIESIKTNNEDLFLSAMVKLTIDNYSILNNKINLLFILLDKDNNKISPDGNIIENDDNSPSTRILSEKGFIKLTSKIPRNCNKVKISFSVSDFENLEQPVEINVNYFKAEIGKNCTPFYPRSFLEETFRLEKLNEEDGYSSLIKKVNDNLIINPNFKINQRDFNSELFNCDPNEKIYNCDNPLNQCFGVDRWMMDSNMKQQLLYNSEGEVDSLRVSFVHWVGICGRYFRQFIEKPESFLNKTLTLSICSKNSSDKVRAQLVGITKSNKEIKSEIISLNTTNTPTIKSISLKIEETLAYLYVEIFPSNRGEYYNYLINTDLVYVKLEEGETATPFIEPKFDVELRKCQKFFQILKIKEISDYLMPGTNYNLMTFNLPCPLRKTPSIDIVSGKYDNLYMDTTNNYTPSLAYKIYSKTNDSFVFGYRSAGGTLSTSTKIYKDRGYGLRDYYDYKLLATSDFEKDKDSTLQTILGKQAKNNYFYTRELDVTFLCDSEIRLQAIPTLKYWCPNPNSNENGNWKTTSSNNYSNAFKAFRNDTAESSYWNASCSTTQDVSIDFGWGEGQGYNYYGSYMCVRKTGAGSGKINVYVATGGANKEWVLSGTYNIDASNTNWTSVELLKFSDPMKVSKIKIEAVPNSGESFSIYVNRFHFISTF